MPPPRDRHQQQGFVLPLVMGTSLVLLLGSVSVHTTSLQSRLQAARELQLRRAEDQLTSAAQQLVAELNRQHPCLLDLALERWRDLGQLCAAPTAVEALSSSEVLGVPYRLIGWQPEGTSVGLLLELGAAQGLPPRQGAFAVTLSPPPQAPLQATDVRLLGLRGVAP
jgi:hypothetical protein